MHGSLHLVTNELASLGYTDLSHVSETETFRVYQGRTRDKQAVLIKLPVSTTPSSRVIHQLIHELEISRGLNPDSAVRPCRIEQHTKLTALVLEDCPYPPLSQWLDEPLQVEPFLALAMGITQALARIHQQGLVHRDITPENIFVTAEGKARFSGFGIASRLTRERQVPVPAEEITATLAYMAPEQSGRMNRSIDIRSDLYSLGMVFYRMLTGRLPFNARDPMEWVQCHLAVQPKPPSECLPAIPPQLSNIVMKLLAKDAQQRYQTAEGLGLDLKQCLDRWRQSSSIKPFELGRMDIPKQLVIPEKLYGRDSEMNTLLSALEQVVAGGGPQLLLVSGQPGVGKSALINEMHRSPVLLNALFAAGSFDQYKGDIPYAPITQALEALVHQLLTRGEKEIAGWREEISNTLQPYGQLVTDLVPDLVNLIGPQPVIPEAPPQEAQNRFYDVVLRFIQLFARPGHPLVLFLDDLQRTDTATLHLLEYLLSQPAVKHLLLLGAYRDNEVNPSHPLRRTIETVKRSGGGVSEIELKPLTNDDVSQFIADALHVDTKQVVPLAKLVQKKTTGNPFLVTRFLTLLADDGLLAFASETGQWRWDLKGIKAKDYSDAQAYLHQARDSYAACGASEKVSQLEQDTGPESIKGQLDATMLIEASQTLSGEIELARLIEALMTITLKSAGADRGLLLLERGGEFDVEAEATATVADIQVQQRHTPIDRSECAETVINQVISTHKNILIDNTSHPGEYFADPYLHEPPARCIYCIPLLRQEILAGVLYLENTQTPGAFSRHRIETLDILAYQAAISLHNACRYQHLRESETQYRHLLQKIQAAVVVHDADTQILTANPKAQELLGLSEAQLLGKSATDPGWHFLREDGSTMPVDEYPANQVAASLNALHNAVIGIERPDRAEPVWALVSALPVFDEADSIKQIIVSFSDITERKKAEQQLSGSEQLFRTLVENSPDQIARYDLNLRRIYVNPALENQFRGTRKKAPYQPSRVSSSLLDPKAYIANLRKVIETGKEFTDEAAYRSPQGEIRWSSARFAPEFDSDGKVQSVLVISNDITPQINAESERLHYLFFLESLDRINRVLQTEGDFKLVMKEVLNEVLEIFDCDRAYLIYPCDPDAETWTIPMESTRPEYPGAGPHGPQPMEEDMSMVMRAMLETDHALRIGPGGNYPISKLARERYGIRSLLAMMLRPHADKPWQFGIQQCSHDRIWSDQELRLFEEIGHRLSEGLNNLLITRDLRDSEANFRLVYENSPVSIQEEDYSAVKSYLESLHPEYGDDLEGYLDTHPEVLEACAGLVRMVDFNRAAMVFHGAESKETMLHGLTRNILPESRDDFRDIMLSLIRGETHIRRESVIQTMDGRRCHINAFFSVCPGYEESLGRILVSLVDISGLKKAEQERQEHLHFLESLDRINLVLQSEGDIEEILKRTLDEVLVIFDCDRAFLQYPCDPDASAEWRIPLESGSPDYPSTMPPSKKITYHPHIEETLRTLLETGTPIQLGPHTDHPIPAEITELTGIRSQMAISIHPKVDRPWQFGIHQCAYDRVWTDQELRLFEEIAHRLSDGLNNLLITRNLRDSEERFRLVYENSPVSIWEEDFSAVKLRLDELKAQCGDDLEGYLETHPDLVKECASLVRILNVNSATLELHQAESKEALYLGLPKTFIQESYDAFRKELVALAAGSTEFKFDGAVQTLQGERREVSVSFSVCPGYEQDLSRIFVSLYDISQRKQDEENLRLAASVFSTSQEGILISNPDNRIIDINPAFSQLTGYSREETLGKNPRFLSAGRHDAAFYAEMWDRINSTGEWQGEVWNQRKSGEVYPEQLSIVAVKDDRGRLQHYVGAFSDISMIKQHEADLDRIAHYDMLTSVPNRRLLSDRLEQAIAYTRRHGKSLAVCYLDLDGFKPINDQYGHEGGDRMLVEIAHRLELMSRGEDTVARLGGDEFVLLWNDIGSDDDCIRALERILDKVSEPMLLEGEQVSVSASIGVTLYPEDNVDADSLLRHADHAMYTAKQLGKNRYQIFDAYLERQISARAELLAMVERGLENGEFELYYQPKVDFTTGEVVGLEALLRWNDPVLGLILPNEFLSLIENDSLAIRVGRLVMEEAVHQAKRWDERGIILPISINIFPRHLKSRSFIDDLRHAIALHWPQIPSHRLLMEIIETSDLEELEPIEEVINECLAMGVGFSLDDFGTGYSSLVYLRRLSIEELKIDKAFVRDMLEDPDDEAIVVGVIGLGKAFGLRVVAEGVESTRQAQHLIDLGCDIVQGYALGRPMPVLAFQKWYAHYLNHELQLCHS